MVDIFDFRSKIGGGVRANQFTASIIYPGAAGFIAQAQGSAEQLLIKSAQLPGSTLGNIDVFFRGRAIKVPGDRTFDDYTMTILNDRNFVHRKALDSWHNIIASNAFNTGAVNPRLTYGQIYVTQLDRSGADLRQYLLFDVYPTTIGPTELSMETNDAIEEYTVTFAVNGFTVVGVETLVDAAQAAITSLIQA